MQRERERERGRERVRQTNSEINTYDIIRHGVKLIESLLSYLTQPELF